MSYILDALKKADRERNLAKVPTLTTLHIPVYVRRRRAAFWVLAGLLMAGGLLYWALRPSPMAAPVARVEPQGVVGGVSPDSAGESARAPVSNQPASGPPASWAVPDPSGPRAEFQRDVRRQAEREPGPMFRPRQSLPSPASQPVPEPIRVESVKPRPAEAARMLPSPVPEVQPSKEAQPARTDPIAPPPVTVLPNQPTLNEAIAKMTLDVFVYGVSEADRMVTINGRRYIKGQLVDGRYLVEDITPEGVLLTFQGERALLRP
jgi:general secretion pathway protein B